MREFFKVIFLVVLFGSLLSVGTSQAASCVTADATGTPLNVRAQPRGTIIMTLDNGVALTVEETRTVKGKVWARISGPTNGWVFKNYLDCSATNTPQTAAKFRINDAKNDCAAQAGDNSEIRNCINESAVAPSSIPGEMRCSSETCMIELSCNGSSCSGSGYSVVYQFHDCCNYIHIKLSSGKKAEYVQCGTCNGIEPVDEKQIPLELLPGDGTVLLEIPRAEAE